MHHDCDMILLSERQGILFVQRNLALEQSNRQRRIHPALALAAWEYCTHRSGIPTEISVSSNTNRVQSARVAPVRENA